ncbi:MAG: hypothetical protein AB1468_06690 [Candidatus Micrarchaeota archaeon]
MKDATKEYSAAAKEFARLALDSQVPYVVLQNTHKAVEFALSAYAIKKGLALPRDHWQSASLAHKISANFGKKFSELLRMYLGSYRLENGEKAKKAKQLMLELLKELEKYAGETFCPR